MPNILVKPRSESDGNLVILADNTREVSLVDLTTGEIIETGRNTGSSNGRESTVRFSRPGGAYRNVGLMDDKGNVLLTLETAGDRVQFNYRDYNGLVQTPVSTIEGYRWDNSKNLEAQATGQPSNAEIAKMSDEEYIQHLESQKGGAQAQGASSPNLASVASTAAPIVAAVYGDEISDGISGLFGSSDNPAPNILSASRIGDGATEAAAEGGLGESLGTVGSYVGPAIQAYNAYNTLSGPGSNEDKGRALGVQGSVAAADYMTGGLASLGRAGVGLLPGGDKALYAADELNPIANMGAGYGSLADGEVDVATGLNLLLPGVPTGLLDDVFGLGLNRKTTKEYQQERTQDLLGGIEDQGLQQDVMGLRDGGQYQGVDLRDQDALDAAKQDGRVLWGSLGVLEAAGPEKWLRQLDEGTRERATRRAAQEDLFTGDKGDFRIKDKDRFNQIIDEELKNPTQDAAPNVPMTAPVQPEALGVEGSVQVPENMPENPQLRGMVPSDTDIDPPITGYEEISGADLPLPGAEDNAMLAYNYMQGGTGAGMANNLMAEAFQPARRAPAASNFEQLAGVFKR